MNPARCLLAAVLVSAFAAAAAAADGPALCVYLPREVRVDGETLALGAITVVQARDAALARQASAVAMGRAPWSKESLVLDRPTILGRLTASGVARDDVRFTGAEKVVVMRREEIVESDAIVAAAEAFLAKTRPPAAGNRWRALRAPDAVAVPAGSAPSLEARAAARGAEREGEAEVEVAAVAAGRTLAVAAVAFRMAYRHRSLVARSEIAAGAVVTPENTEIRTATGDAPEPPDWASPYGARAVRAIPAGAIVRPGLVRAAGAEVLVRRNSSVVMRITGECFQITAHGQALEDGRRGDVIKVRNTDSKRVVVAKVADDGTVEPVFGER